MSTLAGYPLDGDDEFTRFAGSGGADQHADTDVRARLRYKAGATGPQQLTVRTATFVVKSMVIWTVWGLSLLFLSRFAPAALTAAGGTGFLIALSTWVHLFRNWHC